MSFSADQNTVTLCRTEVLKGNPCLNLHELRNKLASGGSLASRHCLRHALAIVNGGEIEDLLGSSKPAFERNLTFENWALAARRFAFIAAVVYLVVLCARHIRWSKGFPWAALEQDEVQTSYILACWIIVPIMIYLCSGINTYPSYFVLFFPVPYLLCAVLLHKLWMKSGTNISARLLLGGVLGIILAGNVSFILNLYGFLGRNGGAQGNYGTILSYKQQAAAYLARNSDVRQLQSEKRLLTINQNGLLEPLNPDIPFLAMQEKTAFKHSRFPPNTNVVIVDRNRSSLTDKQWAHLSTLPKREFGPIQIYVVTSGAK